MSMVLGFAALGFIVMLLLGRMFTVMELRSLERDYRQNQGRFSDLEEDLDTSRRKYLVALKSEGVGKHKVSQLRTRCTSLKQHLEQLELTAAQQETQKAENLQSKLEGHGREGLLKVADRGVVAKSEEGPAAEPKSEAARRERTWFEMQL